MQTIRRLYLYSISMISLELILWGVIGLLRSAFARQRIGGGADLLAGALSLIFVGIPVFLLHWRLAQRGAATQPAERSAGLRAVFLYLVLLFTLIPITQNLIGLVDRLLLLAFGLSPLQAMWGGQQSWSDNLVAIVVNAVAALYFYRVLATDWRSGALGEAFLDIRRLYRYIWLLYGLLLVTFGLQQIIQYMLLVWDAIGEWLPAMLGNGLALLLIGAPLWAYTNRIIQRSLVYPVERNSLIRLVVLYIVVFLSIAGTLLAGGIFLYHFLLAVMGSSFRILGFFGQAAVSISVAIPLGLIWIYYGASLRSEMKAGTLGAVGQETLPLAAYEKDLQRRARLSRLYYYVLAFFGLLALFSGLQFLLGGLIELAFGGETLGVTGLSSQLAAAIASIIIGFPLWAICWRRMMKEAGSESDSGDRARRSLVRKSFLYIILFASVIGVMVGAGVLVYQLLLALLGEPSANLPLAILQPLKTLLLFAGLLAYHWLVLRADNRLSEQALSRRYAQFPVLVLAPDESDFGEVLAQVLQNQAPGLPVAIHPVSQGAPDESLSAARALILPAELTARPGEALRLWLQGYTGEKLVLAVPSQEWYWIPGEGRPLAVLARQAAQSVRQLVEEGTITPRMENNALRVVLYIFAGLFILEIALVAVSFIVSLITR